MFTRLLKKDGAQYLSFKIPSLVIPKECSVKIEIILNLDCPSPLKVNIKSGAKISNPINRDNTNSRLNCNKPRKFRAKKPARKSGTNTFAGA